MKSDSKSMTREDQLTSVHRRQALGRHGLGHSPRNNWIGTSRRRISSVSFDITPIHENDENGTTLNSSSLFNYRRMSAPELPPIHDRVKSSPTQLILQGNLQRRTSYTGRSGSNPQSATSDGSQRGPIAKSPHSANSSSSGRSNGQQSGQLSSIPGKTGNSYHLNRGKTWCVPEQTDTECTIKLDMGKKKSTGITATQITPRSTKNGFRTSRLSSKDNSISSGNNNTANVRRPLPHCKSDPKLIVGELQKSKTFIKRNSSEQKLKDRTENAKNNQRTLSIDKTENLTRNKTTAGNVNGMRRYSSTYVLNINKSGESEDRTTEEYDDSDSDSNKDQYIINWIIGVQSEETEVPPEPEIEYQETPPQTDTAVHIVYGE